MPKLLSSSANSTRSPAAAISLTAATTSKRAKKTEKTARSSKTTKPKKKKKKPSARVQQDPEIVHALVRRLQNDIRELLLARNAMQEQIDKVDKEIASLRDSDPFSGSHAILSKYAVGNLRPNDLLSQSDAASGGASGRPSGARSIDEEIKLLKAFLEKNKFNRVSVEAAVRDLDRLIAELKSKVDQVPAEHRETSSDKRVILQGIEMQIHELQMRGDERRMALELQQERLKAQARHTRDELDEVSGPPDPTCAQQSSFLLEHHRRSNAVVVIADFYMAPTLLLECSSLKVSEELFQAKLRKQAVQARLRRDANQRGALLNKRDHLLKSILGDGDKGSDGWDMMVNHAFSRCRGYGSNNDIPENQARSRDHVTIPARKIGEALSSLLPTAMLRQREDARLDVGGSSGNSAIDTAPGTGANSTEHQDNGMTREEFRDYCSQHCPREEILRAIQDEDELRRNQRVHDMQLESAAAPTSTTHGSSAME